MHCIRANVKFGSYCALFALAVQLLVSFGHIHGIGRSWAPPQAAADRTVAANTAGKPVKPAVPTIDYCAICASISLAGSVVPPATPIIPPPRISGRTLPWRSAEHALAAPQHPDWQARAPPLA
jgi:hypothetical protein